MAAGASGAAPSLAAPPAAAVAAAPPGTSDHPAAAAAGEHALESRRFEVAGMAVTIRQDTRGSGALRPLTGGGGSQRGEGGDGGHEAGQGPAQPPGLSRVGLAVWQAGFVLSDLLLRKPPFGSWHGCRVLDLGCGTGLVGILLALAGAEVTLTDQPHIVPLAESNAQANLTPGLHRARVVPYTWGQGDAAAALLPPAPVPGAAEAAEAEAQPPADLGAAAAAAAPSASTRPEQAPAAAAPPSAAAFDVVTAADVVYQPEQYAALAGTLQALAAPHTLVYLSYKRRGLQEEALLALLEDAGFAASTLDEARLAPEYRGGAYAVVRACRIE